MIKIFHSILLIALPFLLCPIHSCTCEEEQILIYSTNDMHGAIEPYAKILPYMQKERDRGEKVLMLSAGDMFTGNPIVDFHPTRGLPIIQMMNELDYDGATLGNHDFDYGQVALQTCIDSAQFQFVCANLNADSDSCQMDPVKPYIMVNMGKIKVCILGLIETEQKHNGRRMPSCHPDAVKNLEFKDPIQTALSYKYLRKKCNLFIALTHLGYSADSLLAVKMPELDVIVGGHTHTTLDRGKQINGVLVTQSGSQMEYLGKTTVRMKGEKVLEKSFELIETASMKEDSSLKASIQEYALDSVFTEKVGISDYAFPTRRSITFMVADVMRAYFHADFAFQNIGGIRCHSFPKGEIIMNDLYTMNPFNNEVMLVKMNAADIRSFLFSSSKHLKDEVDLVPSGLKYTLTYTGTEISDVKLTDYQGRPLDEEKIYTVVIPSYLSSSYDYTCQEPAVGQHVTQIDMLRDYLKKENLQRPSQEKRWTLIR